jgi:hypothetical protein
MLPTLLLQGRGPYLTGELREGEESAGATTIPVTIRESYAGVWPTAAVWLSWTLLCCDSSLLVATLTRPAAGTAAHEPAGAGVYQPLAPSVE